MSLQFLVPLNSITIHHGNFLQLEHMFVTLFTFGYTDFLFKQIDKHNKMHVFIPCLLSNNELF
jgi:hypothetical protein